MTLPLFIADPVILGAEEIDPFLDTDSAALPSRSIHISVGMECGPRRLSDIRDPLSGPRLGIRGPCSQPSLYNGSATQRITLILLILRPLSGSSSLVWQSSLALLSTRLTG